MKEIRFEIVSCLFNAPATCKLYLEGGSVLTFCRRGIEVADQTRCLAWSQYTDSGLTSSSTDPIATGVQPVEYQC